MALSLSWAERQVLASFAVVLVAMAVLHEVVQLHELKEGIQTQLLEDYYTVLQMPEHGSQGDVALAYRRALNAIDRAPLASEGSQRRGLIITAHEVLSNAEHRATYDQQRRMVRLAIDGLTAAAVGVPLLILAGLAFEAMRRLIRWYGKFGVKPGGFDPKSFEGRLVAMLPLLEVLVDITIQREDPSLKLGMSLAPTLDRSGVLVEAVKPGGAVESHNISARNSGSAWQLPGREGVWSWRSEEVWAGDEFVSVGGETRPNGMMGKFQQSTSSLPVTVKRRMNMKGMLPWVTELDLTRASENEKWGCQILTAQDGRGLDVGAVESGVVERWNLMNPPQAVRSGDRILSIDRHFDSESMIKALRNPATLASSWVIVRGVRDERSEVPAVREHGPFERRPDEKFGIRLGAALQSPLAGAVVEHGGEASIVVKQVVPEYVVDTWNRQAPSADRVLEGAEVVSVNGQTDPREFSNELKKTSVRFELRPPRGYKLEAADGIAKTRSDASASGEADKADKADTGSGNKGDSSSTNTSAAPRRVDTAAEERPLVQKVLGKWTPRFLVPKGFDDRLRAQLESMSCIFKVELSRGSEDRRIGMNLSAARDNIGGCLVGEIAKDGLLGMYNSSILPNSRRRTPEVRNGDRLIAVNKATTYNMMLEVLSTKSVADLRLVFCRAAAKASPGVWEVELERAEGTSWGMTLDQQVPAQGAGGVAVMRVRDVAESGAVHTWNQAALARQSWAMEPEDLIISVDSAIEAAAMMQRLKTSTRVRATLLRWHAGPAPEADDDDGAQSQANAKRSVFDVVLGKSSASDKLGLRLDPSVRDPTRTAVAAVLPGGLVEAHNRRSAEEARAGGGIHSSSWVVRPGDELDAVNGERDPNRFAEGCTSDLIVLTLSRGASADPVAPELGAQVVPDEEPVAACLRKHSEVSSPTDATPAVLSVVPPTAGAEVPADAVAAAAPTPEESPGEAPPSLLPPPHAAAAAEAAPPPEVSREAAAAPAPPLAFAEAAAAPAPPLALAEAAAYECGRPSRVASPCPPMAAADPVVTPPLEVELPVEGSAGPAVVAPPRLPPETARELFMLRAECDALRAEAERSRAARAEGEQHVQREQVERQQAEETLRDLREQLKKSREEAENLRAAQAESGKRERRAQSERQQEEKALRDSTHQVSTLQHEGDLLRAALAASEQREQQTKATLQQAEDALLSLRNELPEARNEAERLRAAQTECEQREQRAQSDKLRAEDALRGLRDRLSELQTKAERLRAAQTQCEQREQSARLEQGQAEEALRDLRAQLPELRDEAARSEAAHLAVLREAEAGSQELRSQLSNLQDEVERSRVLQSELEQRAQRAESEQRLTETALHDEERRLRGLAERAEAMQAENARLAAESAELRAHLAAAQAEAQEARCRAGASVPVQRLRSFDKGLAALRQLSASLDQELSEVDNDGDGGGTGK